MQHLLGNWQTQLSQLVFDLTSESEFDFNVSKTDQRYRQTFATTYIQFAIHSKHAKIFLFLIVCCSSPDRPVFMPILYELIVYIYTYVYM